MLKLDLIIGLIFIVNYYSKWLFILNFQNIAAIKSSTILIIEHSLFYFNQYLRMNR